MPHPITRYQCNFCRKHYSTKYDATKHEGGCLCNPLNRSCSTCNNRTGDYCDKLFRPVFIKGEKIFNCLSWKAQREYEEEFE